MKAMLRMGYVIALGLASIAFAAEPVVSRDAGWAPYATQAPMAVEAVSTSHVYVTMRDGVKIAITVYLPAVLAAGEKRPTILQSTRYMRAYDLRWPFEGKEAAGDRLRTFLAHGYAYVSADSRGSGASFGRWPCPWAPDEVKDYGELCDWIVKQPWSDGKIGCRGISYDGTTAEMTATTMHPAIKAIVPEFSLFDSYTDVGFPGGIHLAGFTKVWSEGNAALDANAVQKKLGGLQRFVLKGVQRVDEDTDGSMLEAAVASHVWNGDVFAACNAINFKDDYWLYEPSLNMNDISPSGKIDALRKTAIPIYSYSGWFDGAYQNSAINRYLTIQNPGSKLVIGPWSHGGRYNSSPAAQTATAFDHGAELLRFFDFHLRGIDTGIDTEAPIHYYTLIEEKWKSCDTWPPAATNTTYYFAGNNRLETSAPTATAAADVYTPDYTATTGPQARWDSLMGGKAVTYPNRAEEDKKLLTYTTAPLAADTEVTGHGLATLYIATQAADGQFIVYLEDVDERGVVQYVTEGELRGLCRKVSDETPPYVELAPYHTYLRKDAEILKPGEVTELTFGILPTSYLFKKGHRIRIAVAGADAAHFQPPLFPPQPVQYLRDVTHASRVVLPIVSR